VRRKEHLALTIEQWSTDMWYKTPVSIFVERFVLTVCAALVVTLLATNPFKFDWWQRASLALAITSLALFFAVTVHKAKTRAESDAKPRQGSAAFTDINRNTRLAISPTPSEMAGTVTPVTGAAIVLQNLSDEFDRHIYIKFASPAPITKASVDSPERVRIISGGPESMGPGGSRVLELSAPELAPHESRIIRFSIAEAKSGDFMAGFSSERCGKDCKNVAIVRPSLGPSEEGPPRR
jgi:hypothetical protein